MSLCNRFGKAQLMNALGGQLLMQERADLKYMTDIMPVADAKFRTLFEGRYFATPKKMGAQTAEANINAGIAAAKQIVDFIQNGNTRFQVNK